MFTFYQIKEFPLYSYLDKNIILRKLWMNVGIGPDFSASFEMLFHFVHHMILFF